MACKNTNDFRLVDDAPSLKDAISELKQKMERNTILAVDCEGVSLSRKGALTIITVATEEKVYIFDVLKLGQAVFSSGLGEILEDKSREKLMFDCRQDSDALWYGGPQLSRQQQKAHGKNKKLTAETKCSRRKQKRSRQKQKAHGKSKKLTAKAKKVTVETKCSRQKQKAHGEKKKLTAKTKSSR